MARRRAALVIRAKCSDRYDLHLFRDQFEGDNGTKNGRGKMYGDILENSLPSSQSWLQEILLTLSMIR